jgi:hypothetical protein
MSRASYLSVILKSVIWRNSCWVVARLPRRNGYSRTSVSNGAAKRGPTERGIVGWAFSCSGHTLGNSNVPTFRKSRGTLHPDLRPPTPAIRLVRANSERHLSCRYNMSLLHCGGILYGCRRARWLTGQATGWRAPGNNAAASTSPLRNGSVPAQTACPNRSPSSMERPRSRPRPEALIGVKLPATCSDTFTDILQAIVMLVYGM